MGEFYYYFFLNQLPLFVFGAVLRHLIKHNLLDLKEFNCILFSIFLVIFFGFISGSSYPLQYHYVYGVAFGFLIIGAYSFLAERSGKLSINCVAKLGRQSYAIFLTHLLIMHPSAYLIKFYLPNLTTGEFFSIHLSIILLFSFVLSNYLFNKVDIFFVFTMNRYIRRKNV